LSRTPVILSFAWRNRSSVGLLLVRKHCRIKLVALKNAVRFNSWSSSTALKSCTLSRSVITNAPMTAPRPPASPCSCNSCDVYYTRPVNERALSVPPRLAVSPSVPCLLLTQEQEIQNSQTCGCMFKLGENVVHGKWHTLAIQVQRSKVRITRSPCRCPSLYRFWLSKTEDRVTTNVGQR